jgi:dethiobiotin synthetase
MPTKPTALFITGTDTGVGKTHVSVSLVKALVKHGLRVSVMKPIASGSDPTPEGLRNTDAQALAEASNVAAAYATINPYCFEPAISPHIAAEEAQIDIDLSKITQGFEALRAIADFTVVEGAGGWYAPISTTQSMADLPKALNIPVVLVVGVRLGCLNHAKLSKEAIEASGVELAGWVANSIDPTLERAAENLASLERMLGKAPLAVFPFAKGAAVATVAAGIATRAAIRGGEGVPGSAVVTAREGALPAAHPNVRCGEHFARGLSLISF